VKRVNWVGIFFVIAGVALVIVGNLPSVTDALDSAASEGSDPSGDVLPMIGIIWALVGVFVVGVTFLAGGGGRTFKDIFSNLGGKAKGPQPEKDDDNALFTIDLSGAKDGSQADHDKSVRLAQLEQLKAGGLLSDAEYAEAKAKLDA
jgi:hypothetical protein